MSEIINKSEFEELKKRILKKYKDDADILKMIEQLKTGIIWEGNDEKINGNIFEEVTEKRIGENGVPYRRQKYRRLDNKIEKNDKNSWQKLENMIECKCSDRNL